MLLILVPSVAFAQPNAAKPCAGNAMYRQFDFWIGNWEVYATNGKVAGLSRVEIMLDSCVLQENWTSSGGNYAGKSFNTYNILLKQWQQTWVDDKGGMNEYFGSYADNKMELITKPFAFSKDTTAIRKMSFYNLGSEKVRQFGEISKDNGSTWVVEFDLEYRRKRSK